MFIGMRMKFLLYLFVNVDKVCKVILCEWLVVCGLWWFSIVRYSSIIWIVLIFIVVLCIMVFFCGESLLFWNKIFNIWNGSVDR